MTKIPLRDYGVVQNFADNALPKTLKSDAHASGPGDAYAYASTSAIGIAVDEVVIYPDQKHPPLIGFGLDEFGGHSDATLGYHYHAHLVAAKTAQGTSARANPPTR